MEITGKLKGIENDGIIIVTDGGKKVFFCQKRSHSTVARENVKKCHSTDIKQYCGQITGQSDQTKHLGYVKQHFFQT